MNLPVAKCDRSNSGIAVVEMAVILPVLFFTIAFVTDLSLGILASVQVQNAARAGGEFATVYGYDADGIKNAADLAVAKSIVPVTTASVTVSMACACTDSTGIVYNTGDTTGPNCTAVKCDGGAIDGTAFATISVTSSYTPLFPALWSLVSGSRSIQARVVARTSRPIT